jgi:hypothetical protein
MIRASRQNFSAQVRRSLAIRAAHFCSNPRCLKLTAGPASDDKRGLETGHGAHICAAAPGGPRYDPNQTQEERKGAANGLWLCRECGDVVDKDEAGYSPNELRAWKSDHEAMIAEVRTQGWARSIELLRSGRTAPALAEKIITLFEDRRVFWAAFDAERPSRVRHSLDDLRRDLTRLRSDCAAGSPLDVIIVALGRTIRHFYDVVEPFDMDTLRCYGCDPNWQAFASAFTDPAKSDRLPDRGAGPVLPHPASRRVPKLSNATRGCYGPAAS